MKYLMILMISLILAGCVNQPRNFKPAGFDSYDEVKPYGYIRDYLAANLTDADWKAFYKRFPEYWQNLQAAKSISLFGGVNENHPIFTAYNFRWTTLNRKKTTWNDEKIERLRQALFIPGDTPFEIFYVKGAPDRMLWDNDFEILFYKPDIALIMESGRLKEKILCNGCWETPTNTDDDAPKEEKTGMYSWDILATLGLKRPVY